MGSVLYDAHRILFGSRSADELKEWQLAREVLGGWNVPKLGEDLAKKCLFEIINHVRFPNNDLTREIVEIAEDKAEELFPELEGRDPHMAVIENLERAYLKDNRSSV